MEAASVLCLCTNTHASWIVVPTRKIGTLDCVTLSSSKSPWAIRALTHNAQKRKAREVILVLRAFAADVRVQLAKGTPTLPDVSPPSLKRPRPVESDEEEVIGTADSGDDEATHRSDATTPEQVSPCQTQRLDKVGFTKIAFDGLEVNAGF